jgi:hypothetical protein
LESPTIAERAGPGELAERFHRPGDLGDLPGATVIGPVEHRHPTVTGDGKPCLDLLEVGSPVLRVPEPGRSEARLRVCVSTEQADRGHVPVQPGRVQAERADRGGPDRPDDAGQLRGDRVQRPADPVVVERGRIDPEDLLHGPLAGPLLDVHQRRR